jgi:hypothetical protein
MPHSIFHSDACFAYFNKNWGIPARDWAETLGNPLSVSARYIVVGQINAVRIAHRPAISNVKSISGHFASQPSDTG